MEHHRPQLKVTYVAKRDPDDNAVTARRLTVSPDLEWRFSTLSPRLDLRNHSPTGFNLAGQGSGCAQLALAILVDAIGPERAIDLYQKFKREFVARSGEDEFQVTLEAVQEWAARQALPPTDALDAWGESLGE